MPRSIAQLIFSGLGSINFESSPRTRTYGVSARSSSRRSSRNRYTSPSSSGSHPRRDPSTGRFTSLSHRRGTAGSSAVSSAAAGEVSVPASRVSISFRSPSRGFTDPASDLSRGVSAPASAAAAASHPFAHSPSRPHRGSSSHQGGSDTDDDEVAPLDGPASHPAYGGYDTFVRRVRANAASAGSSSAGRAPSSSAAARDGGVFSFPSNPFDVPPPRTRRGVPPANTADTAIEIGDSDDDDDDDEVICVD